MGKIYIGTSGYNYKHWKEVFYPKNIPPKNWLSYYSKHFDTVEINATFYGNFKKETFEKWKNSTPKDFCFAIKGPRFITHIKRLKTEDLSLKRFFDSALGLGKKLGVILWQFAPNFHNNQENKARLVNFLKLLKTSAGLPAGRQVFEFRHKSWFAKEVYDLLDKSKTGIVISESGRFPSEDKIISDICYIRFHGPSSLYSSSYSTKQLENWAQKIKNWKVARIYCFFNNDAQAFAVKNALKLRRILNEKNHS
ncbi:MAG: hypothetical protein UT20_C0006G0033 [Candidatus Levybacteria bacterium GW2011_GWA1_39_11]|nr:MAG: hypothetical protein UT20_C0006G0033 [Candidatus Levybacteria bacterium GW2011_GWA1_39_11]